ncbi:MAG: hypothetical protein ACYST0_01970 [Planctomycetota bacterium]
MACITFGLTYLLTMLLGGDGLTAVIRATIVALVTLVVGRLLFRPLIASILDGIAQHQAAQTKAKEDR